MYESTPLDAWDHDTAEREERCNNCYRFEGDCSCGSGHVEDDDEDGGAL